MTTATPPGSAYPPAIEALMPKAREIVQNLGGLPSQNRLVKEFRIGANKAGVLLSALRTEYATLTNASAPPVVQPLPEAPPTTIESADPAPVDQPDADEPVGIEVQPSPEPVPVAAVVPVAVEPEAAGPAVDRVALRNLRRLGWATRMVFTLGVTASLAGNVLHAEGNLISQIISAWSPIALLLTVELITRIPVRRGLASFARLMATAAIAGIAAWISYWHMAAVAAQYGESGGAEYLLPLSVDGLIIVASISLVEIGSRIRHMTLGTTGK